MGEKNLEIVLQGERHREKVVDCFQWLGIRSCCCLQLLFQQLHLNTGKIEKEERQETFSSCFLTTTFSSLSVGLSRVCVDFN